MLNVTQIADALRRTDCSHAKGKKCSRCCDCLDCKDIRTSDALAVMEAEQLTDADVDKFLAAEIVKELCIALEVAINTVECASLDKDGNELPWYKGAKKALEAAGRPWTGIRRY